MFERLPAFFMGFGVAAAAASYFIREDITGSHALLAKQGERAEARLQELEKRVAAMETSASSGE